MTIVYADAAISGLSLACLGLVIHRMRMPLKKYTMNAFSYLQFLLIVSALIGKRQRVVIY
jgi:hypothetical protein